MIFKNINQIKDIDFEVVIIGSGPAGISLALKLEKKKIKSLIIEAGPEEFSDTSQEFYTSKLVGDTITNLKESRLRQFGGTSAIWGGWSKPMEKYNLTNWGITYSELEKFSNEACKILNINNNFRKSNISKHFNQIEFQYSPVRFNEKYKDHITKSFFINLILNTQATKFIGNENKTESVECIFNNQSFKIKSKFFILCAGGIENSRILLWSRINGNLINKNSPVGMHWMTHPWFLGGYGVLKKKELSKFLGNNYINRDGPLHIASSNILKKEKNILSGSIYMDVKENKKFYKEIIKDLLCVAPEFGKKIARNILEKDLKCGNIFMHLEDPPNNENKISLDINTKDNNGIPITNLFYKESQKTLLTAKIILEEFGDICRKFNFGRIAIKKDIDDLKKYESLGVYHHIGGTRIGKDSKNSVVDENLKIHDNKNLYVLGSSIFPTSGYTNPTFTIIQLSLRLGEKISRELS